MTYGLLLRVHFTWSERGALQKFLQASLSVEVQAVLRRSREINRRTTVGVI